MSEPTRRGHPRAALGLILNLLVPGVGTFVVGRHGVGTVQLALSCVAAFLNLTGTMAVVGFPLWIAVWMWALITSIGASSAPS